MGSAAMSLLYHIRARVQKKISSTDPVFIEKFDVLLIVDFFFTLILAFKKYFIKIKILFFSLPRFSAFP